MSQKDFTEDIFSKYVETALKNVHTCLPGRIESYTKSQRKAKVKVLIRYRTDLETEIEIPPIDNVPVIFPSGKNFTLEWPLEKNDGCLVLFSEEGIGNFLNSTNQEVDPDSYARFQLTDAICLPGLFSFKGVPNSKATIEIDSSGNININNGTKGAVREGDSVITKFSVLDNTAWHTWFLAINALVPGYPGVAGTASQDGEINSSSNKVKIG